MKKFLQSRVSRDFDGPQIGTYEVNLFLECSLRAIVHIENIRIPFFHFLCSVLLSRLSRIEATAILISYYFIGKEKEALQIDLHPVRSAESENTRYHERESAYIDASRQLSNIYVA